MNHFSMSARTSFIGQICGCRTLSTVHSVIHSRQFSTRTGMANWRGKGRGRGWGWVVNVSLFQVLGQQTQVLPQLNFTDSGGAEKCLNKVCSLSWVEISARANNLKLSTIARPALLAWRHAPYANLGAISPLVWRVTTEYTLLKLEL